MAKPEVAIYLLLAIAFLLLLAFSPPPPPGSNHRRQRTSRRLAHSTPHHHFNFDPRIDQLERRAKERNLLDLHTFQQTLDKVITGSNDRDFPEEIGALEDYFGEEGRLNLTERLMYLFPLLDRSPRDGVISFDELERWNHRQVMDQLHYNTQLRTRDLDKDRDGNITLLEFLKTQTYEDIDLYDMNKNKGGWWREQFENADEDLNGLLNATEFRNFIYPEDSKSPDIELWLLEEKIREMDQDHDRRVSLKEFQDRAFQIYRTFEFDLDQQPDRRVPDVVELFTELDSNNNKFLTAEELRPIFHKLYPGELSRATRFTKFLMHEADGDKDGKLTLTEMLNHKYAFYSTVMEEGRYDEDDYDMDDYYLKDELRR